MLTLIEWCILFIRAVVYAKAVVKIATKVLKKIEILHIFYWSPVLKENAKNKF